MSPLPTVVQFLADREELGGGARERFLEILRGDFRYGDEKAPEENRNLVTVPAISASAAVLIAVWMLKDGLSWLDGTAWLGCAWLATVVHWWLSREKKVATDYEAEWRAYCVLVRPMILVRYPRLLDRNRRNTEYQLDEKPFSIAQSLQVTAHHAKRELAVAAVVGLWIGAALVAVLHYLSSVELIALTLLPLASALGVPLLWALWRWCALRTVLQDLED